MTDALLRLHTLLVRDFVTAVAARDDVTDSMLESFAKRRAPLYARPDVIPTGGGYWTGVAAALAPIGPPSWMPMEALVLGGHTLEGGARGLRGLFTREPSDKERKRVLRIATLAGRILQIVASADATVRGDEAQLIEMAMNSFGLNPEERGKTRLDGPPSFETLDVPADLDARTRHELLRGAWQLALIESLDPAKDVMVRGIAGHLGASAEYDTVRSEVQHEQRKQSEMAQVAIDLVRASGHLVPAERMRPWLEHLVDAAVPPARRHELRGLALGNSPTMLDAVPRLDGDHRRQAIALAAATLLGGDPIVSVATVLRAQLVECAEHAGIGGSVEPAFALIDRWMLSRTVTHASALLAPPTPAAITQAAPPAPAGAAGAVHAVPVVPAATATTTVVDDEQKPETD
ncbi:MAG: hypothetical protein WCJ30_26350 [Deltaproteobacteria bacterium]